VKDYEFAYVDRITKRIQGLNLTIRQAVEQSPELAEMLERLAEKSGVVPAHGRDESAPAAFPEYDESIETDHRCPKCGYEWSGKAQ